MRAATDKRNGNEPHHPGRLRCSRETDGRVTAVAALPPRE